MILFQTSKLQIFIQTTNFLINFAFYFRNDDSRRHKISGFK